MRIRGIDKLSLPDIEREVGAGGRFVYYEYCVSVIVATTRRPTDVFFLPAEEWGVMRGLPYCLLSLLCGWWGIHWGLIYTPLTLYNNLSGGCDVTDDVLALLQTQADSAPEPEGRTPSCDET